MTGALITAGLSSAAAGAYALAGRRRRDAQRRRFAQIEAQAAERLRQVRVLRVGFEQSERGTELIDCLEIWGRLPTRVPPHEVGR